MGQPGFGPGMLCVTVSGQVGFGHGMAVGGQAMAVMV